MERAGSSHAPAKAGVAGPTASGRAAERRPLQGAPGASRWSAIATKTHVMTVATDGEVRGPVRATAGLKAELHRCALHALPASSNIQHRPEIVQQRRRAAMAHPQLLLVGADPLRPLALHLRHSHHRGKSQGVPDASEAESCRAQGRRPQVSCRAQVCMSAWGSPHQLRSKRRPDGCAGGFQLGGECVQAASRLQPPVSKPRQAMAMANGHGAD